MWSLYIQGRCSSLDLPCRSVLIHSIRTILLLIGKKYWKVLRNNLSIKGVKLNARVPEVDINRLSSCNLFVIILVKRTYRWRRVQSIGEDDD